MLKRNTLANQVSLEILKQIDSGELVSRGKELPSEDELTRRFDVSRGTIREAMIKLEQGGVVIRRHGVGTYISPLVLQHPGSVLSRFDKKLNFIDFIQDEGFKAECSLLDIGITRANSYADSLEIEPEKEVLFIERLYSADSSPIIHCYNVIPIESIDPQYRDNISSNYDCYKSIYTFISQNCNTTIHNQKSEVNAVSADKKMSAALECKPDTPLLLLKEIGYGSKMKPLFYAQNHALILKISYCL